VNLEDFSKPIVFLPIIVLCILVGVAFYTGFFTPLFVGAYNWSAERWTWLLVIFVVGGGVLLYLFVKGTFSFKPIINIQPLNQIREMQAKKYKGDFMERIEYTKRRLFYTQIFCQLKEGQTEKASHVGTDHLVVANADPLRFPAVVHETFTATEIPKPGGSWLQGRGDTLRTLPLLRARTVGDLTKLALGYDASNPGSDILSLAERGEVDYDKYIEYAMSATTQSQPFVETTKKTF